MAGTFNTTFEMVLNLKLPILNHANRHLTNKHSENMT